MGRTPAHFVKADLHTHSNCSDGTLPPLELLTFLQTSGVEVASITDHDTLAAYESPPVVSGITLIPGVEFSTTVAKAGVHVVGLGVRTSCPDLLRAVAQQKRARASRAERIAQALEAAGLPNLLSDACARSGNDTPGRPHFAAGVVAAGRAKDAKQAFARYLGRGKRGDVKADWAELSTVINWIHDAGGIAVLAHPARYKLNRNKLIGLIKTFAECGGRAIEVISGRQDPATTGQLAKFAGDFGLLSSVGSDFHSPDQVWLKPGKIEVLPPTCEPVWAHL
jgi:3',5'-nucleoside bisphosphate phosphatase